MQNYLTQYHFKSYTIRLPLVDKQYENQINLNPSEFADEMTWYFFNFLRKYKGSNWVEIPHFCFLNTFYKVQFIAETDRYSEFKLIEYEKLNRSMFLRLRHTIFNQYNALIGFSEVLNEVEVLDDTDHLLLDRINSNAREMFQNTKMLMEYEEFLDINFELKARQVNVSEYFSSYFRHHNFQNVSLNYDSSGAEVFIDNEAFKTSLDSVFSLYQSVFSSLEGQIKTTETEQLEISFVLDSPEDIDQELAHEVLLLNQFFGNAKSPAFMSYRMFHLSYIRLVAEKLHGKFDIILEENNTNRLCLNWTFPFERGEEEKKKHTEDQNLKNDISWEAPEIKSVPFSSYPRSVRNEILKNFEDVEDAFVLDHWESFADSLEKIGRASEEYSSNELTEIIHDIRQAVTGFDVISLQRIRNKLKHIRELE